MQEIPSDRTSAMVPPGSQSRHSSEEAGQCPWSEGRQESKRNKSMNRETKPATVPAKDRPEGEDLWQRYGAERGIWTKAMLIALHQRRVGGNKWFSLIDKVASDGTLGIAWEKVAANAGACGVDRVTIGHFGKDSQKRLLAVKEHLSKGYFDNIPHDALMRLVRERVADGKVLGLVEGFLKQGVLENGKEIEAQKGSPQGGLISPLLANIYLNPLDWLMEELGFKSVRYADVRYGRSSGSFGGGKRETRYCRFGRGKGLCFI